MKCLTRVHQQGIVLKSLHLMNVRRYLTSLDQMPMLSEFLIATTQNKIHPFPKTFSYVMKDGKVIDALFHLSNDIIHDKETSVRMDIDSLRYLIMSIPDPLNVPWIQPSVMDYFKDPELEVPFGRDEIVRVRGVWSNERLAVCIKIQFLGLRTMYIRRNHFI